MKQSLRTSTAVSAFAHLLGIGAAKPSADDGDEDRKEEAARAESDTDDDDSDKKDAKGKKAKKAKAEDGAEDDEEDAADEDDDSDEDDGEDKDKKDAQSSGKGGKKAKADDEDASADDDYAKGKKAERARWAKVLKAPAAAGGRVAAACSMLANSPMSSAAIIATLEELPEAAAPAAGRRGLGERMSAAVIPNVGSGSASGDKPDLAAQIVAAGRKARGEKA